jgi:transposase-like protein
MNDYTPVTAPTNGNGLVRPCSCVNKKNGFPKQWYKTQAEADDAAKRINDKYPDQDPQYPYQCEQADVWHLTSRQPGDIGSSVCSKLARGMRDREAAGITKRTRRSYPDSLKQDAVNLRAKGLTFAEIADQLDVGGESGGGNLIAKWVRDGALRPIPAPATVKQFETEEQILEKKLAEIRAKKQAAIEAKQWKLTPCWDGKGVLLSKEGNKLGVLLEDAEELIILLDDYLKERGPRK